MSNSKVCNSVGYVGIQTNVHDGKTYVYKGIWSGLFCVIPLEDDKDVVFEVDAENNSGNNTCKVTVHQDTALVERVKDNSFNGGIDGDKLVNFVDVNSKVV